MDKFFISHPKSICPNQLKNFIASEKTTNSILDGPKIVSMRIEILFWDLGILKSD